MNEERTEYEFNYARFMGDVRRMMGDVKCTLREIEARTGVSASSFSRVDNGGTLDMDTFMRVCAIMDLTPGDYFKRVVWMRKGE